MTKLDVESGQDLAKQAEDLAKQAGKKLAVEAVEVGRRRIERRRIRHRTERGRRKLERRLEKAAKRLPVDTPVDKRRRRRTASRTAWVVRIVLASAVAAAIYFAWRARNRREGTAEAGPAPDAFGAALDASEDGEHASTLTSPEA